MNERLLYSECESKKKKKEVFHLPAPSCENHHDIGKKKKKCSMTNLTTTTINTTTTRGIPKISKFDKKLSFLGKGISGYVQLYQTRNPLGLSKTRVSCTPTLYAVKVALDKDSDELLHEYYVLKELGCHQNIIIVYKYEPLSFSSSKAKLYMEAARSENLHTMLKNMLNHNEQELYCIWKQIVNGVQYLHELDICHRDLKLENLVFDLDFKFIKIIDFATAHKLKTKDELSVGLVGSKKYAAPETFASLKYDGKAADMWALGIICYYIFNGRRFPWSMAHHSDVDYMEYKELGTLLPMEQVNSDKFKHVISNLLLPDQLERYSIYKVYKSFIEVKSCTCDTTCGFDHKHTFGK